VNDAFIRQVVVVVNPQVPAKNGGSHPVDTLAQDLNPGDAQIQNMRQIFQQFAEKQSQVPTPGQVLLGNRVMLGEVLISKKFDRQKADQLVNKVTSINQLATVNRLGLLHDLYQQLMPEQR
jgi:Spy/CpxP family protein refolding chaperone